MLLANPSPIPTRTLTPTPNPSQAEECSSLLRRAEDKLGKLVAMSSLEDDGSAQSGGAHGSDFSFHAKRREGREGRTSPTSPPSPTSPITPKGGSPYQGGNLASGLLCCLPCLFWVMLLCKLRAVLATLRAVLAENLSTRASSRKRLGLGLGLGVGVGLGLALRFGFGFGFGCGLGLGLGLGFWFGFVRLGACRACFAPRRRRSCPSGPCPPSRRAGEGGR